MPFEKVERPIAEKRKPQLSVLGHILAEGNPLDDWNGWRRGGEWGARTSNHGLNGASAIERFERLEPAAEFSSG